jgi:hypothetical protein
MIEFEPREPEGDFIRLPVSPESYSEQMRGMMSAFEDYNEASEGIFFASLGEGDKRAFLFPTPYEEASSGEHTEFWLVQWRVLK